MKRYFCILAVPLLCLIANAASPSTSEAAKHVGENATVCGVVASFHTATNSKGPPTFVNLDKAYPNQVFTILNWGEDLGKFSTPFIFDLRMLPTLAGDERNSCP